MRRRVAPSSDGGRKNRLSVEAWWWVRWCLGKWVEDESSRAARAGYL